MKKVITRANVTSIQGFPASCGLEVNAGRSGKEIKETLTLKTTEVLLNRETPMGGPPLKIKAGRECRGEAVNVGQKV